MADETGFLGVDLPAESLFSEAEYRQMYELSSHLRTQHVLQLLNRNDVLSPTELRRLYPGLDVDDIMGKLKRVGLVREERVGFVPLYSLSTLGQVIVTKGPKEGVRDLMERERGFVEEYSRD